MNRDYSDKLFVVEEATGMIEFNKDEAREIPAFRAVLWADKGGVIKGDPDGRKKYLARKELYYVYIMADPFTLYSTLNEKRRHQVALENTELIAVEGWKPSKEVKAAIAFYKEDFPTLTPTAKAFLNSKKALDNIGEDLSLLNDYNQTLREAIDRDKDITLDDSALEEDKQRAMTNLNASMQALSANNKEIFAITSTLPDRMEALEKLRRRLAKEDSESATPIGGGKIGRRETA